MRSFLITRLQWEQSKYVDLCSISTRTSSWTGGGLFEQSPCQWWEGGSACDSCFSISTFVPTIGCIAHWHKMRFSTTSRATGSMVVIDTKVWSKFTFPSQKTVHFPATAVSIENPDMSVASLILLSEKGIFILALCLKRVLWRHEIYVRWVKLVFASYNLIRKNISF